MLPLTTAESIPTAYVNGNIGNDSNSGTSASPFKTVAKVIEATPDKGTVFIANGIYKGEGNIFLDIDKNVNIVDESQEGVIFDGENKNSFFRVLKQAKVKASFSNLTNKKWSICK
ncbi:MAG: DUF1565 domain-containing protein [Methanobrevibacter sp.]|jgi:hypothetical protein|nr:DUF1565 domain-containing protein [Methanobrevibacter sp.]